MENTNRVRPGVLYVCPTPIGNLEDITIGVLRVLREVDIILCEDTRHSSSLLRAYHIKKPLLSYHKFNEEKRLEAIIEHLKDQKSIALISDAGMPGVSDPGEVILQKLLEEGMEYRVLPGPSAHVTASVSAIIKDGRYLFYGFLPQKNGPRNKVLEGLKDFAFPLGFYEAPHRIEKTIGSIDKIMGHRDIVLVRELTKIYEQVVFTNSQEFLENPSHYTLKGEFVLFVMPGEKEEETIDIASKLQEKLDTGMKMSQAVKEVAKENNLAKNLVYKESLNIS